MCGGVGLKGFHGSLDPAQVWVQGGPGAARGGSAQMDSAGGGARDRLRAGGALGK